MAVTPWWKEQCPKRGPALSHAHSSSCDGVHPHDASGNEGNEHPYNMCCHCQMTQAMSEASDEATKARGARPERPIEEHEYMGSITGRCVRTGCGRPPDEHIVIEHVKVPGQCPVKHSSIKQLGLSIGDEGLTWKKCPGCGIAMEPRMTLGEPQGKADGIGRGWVSPRMKARWEDLARQMRTS